MRLRRMARSLGRVARTRYPSFLLGAGLPGGEIPAFVFHDVEPQTFRTDLEFLDRNGYTCITTDEFVERGGRARGERLVLLTFDDGLRSFRSVVVPLLLEFRAPATLFVPTFWPRGASPPPGECSVNPGDRDPFLSWEDLRVCRDSGLVDVQPHGHRHALVPTSERVVAFATPATLERSYLFDWPMRTSSEGDRLGRPAVGTPVYASQPLLSTRRCVASEPLLAGRCREFVQVQGGKALFETADWDKRLRMVWNQARRDSGPPRVMKGPELEALVASEFELSADLFLRELGTRPRYLAYPWELGSEASLDLARGAGTEAAFGVGMDFRRARRLKGTFTVFGRFKGDWLRFLPGQGRLSLAPVLARKAREFTTTLPLAH